MLNRALMRKSLVSITLFSVLVSFAGTLLASGRTEAGLTLLEASSARSAALGEAFTAASNDISAFTYNPANLFTFEKGQASFLYQQGAFDDSYGQLVMGYPRFKDAFGISIGYYDGGEAAVFDGVSQRSVTAQSDLTVGLGYSTQYRYLAIGVTGKYLSSELAETVRAKAFAADVGVVYPLHKRVLVAGALQNIGNKLEFVSEGDELPRIGRAGIQWVIGNGRWATLLLLDVPYYMNQQELRPAIGLEKFIGPLAIRAGYKSGNDLEEFSIGTGFLLGASSFDYSFGLVDEFESRHRISVSMQFGAIHLRPSFRKYGSISENKKPVQFIKKNPEQEPKKSTTQKKPRPVFLMTNQPGKAPETKVYFVKPGDTLRSIAREYYGFAGFWDEIYRANQHLFDNLQDLEPGQKIILPKREN